MKLLMTVVVALFSLSSFAENCEIKLKTIYKGKLYPIERKISIHFNSGTSYQHLMECTETAQNYIGQYVNGRIVAAVTFKHEGISTFLRDPSIKYDGHQKHTPSTNVKCNNQTPEEDYTKDSAQPNC